MRFVWVSDRVPKGLPRFCAYCCGKIGEAGYLRELGTRIIYCGSTCYTDHCNLAISYMEARHVHDKLVATAQPPLNPAPLRLLPRPVPASGDMA